MSSILLLAVNARFMHSSWSLRCLKAALGPLEQDCLIHECVLKSTFSEAFAVIESSRPRILGISVYIWNHDWVRQFLHELWKLSWGVEGGGGQSGGLGERPLIVLGGPQASHAAADFRGLAEVVVQGEGELAFRELAVAYLGDSVAWRLHRGLDAHGQTCPEQPVMIQGSFADPACFADPCGLYTDEDLFHNRFVYVESSRGCPYACSFCLSSVDTGVRFADEDLFLAAMKTLVDRGARRFKILDRTFNARVPRAVRILQFFRNALPPGAFVHVELVPHVLPPELREVIASYPEGMLRLEIGIQTFNPLSARLVNRVQDLDLELENLAWLRDHSAALVHADLIAGLPGEDMASFARGFDLMWNLRPGEIQLGLLKCLPGTPLSALGVEWGMEYDTLPPYRIRKTSVLAETDVEALARFARFWELVVNRGHFDDLIGDLLPPNTGAFNRFMQFSQDTWNHFGRGHGLDRAVLRNWILGWISASRIKA